MKNIEETEYLALINNIDIHFYNNFHHLKITNNNLTKSNININICNNLQIKYNYIADNKKTNNIFRKFIYLENYPDIFIYKNSLVICNEYYNIISKSSNNIINLWKYNLKNGYLLEKDDKIYIFLMINNEFINLLYEDNYWICNQVSNIIIDNFNEKYYLIELHYTLLFPLINDDIIIRNEKLIALFLSLLISKNHLLPLFFYNMINLKYIKEIKDNIIFKLFIKVIENDLIDSPFKILYLLKFKDINIKYKNEFKKRKDYLNISKIDIYHNDYYTINLEEKIRNIINNSFILDKKYELNIEDDYNNIFNNLFISNNIISLQYLYNTYYNNFYNLIYKSYINEIRNINDKNTKNKLITLISLHNFQRSTEDIIFEIHTKKLINLNQKNFITYIDNKLKFNEVQQLLMGSGKTSVITPLIILKYYFKSVYSNFIIVLPNYLVNQSYNIINSFMNIIYNFSDDFKSEFKNQDNGYNNNNKIFITSDSIIKKNILTNIYNNNGITTIMNKKNTYFIFDEIDSLINPLKSDLNIPINHQKHPNADKIYEDCIINYKIYRQNKTNINKTCNKNSIEIKINNSNINIEPKNLNDKNLPIYLQEILNNKIIDVIRKLDILKYNKDYGFGDYINCYESNNNIKNNKNYFLAIPYNYIDSPVNCSEFSDYEILLIFTINSYIENGKLRIYDVLLIYELFAELYKISKYIIEFKYNKLIKDLKKYDSDIINKILKIDTTNKISIIELTDKINNLLNIEDIIYSYIEFIIYPNFFEISFNQYNISTVDILGESFANNKITFSGTVDFQLPAIIINEIISKNNISKINNALSYCLKDIHMDNSSNNNINDAFYGRKTEKPKILLFKKIENNIEECLLNYLFKETNIIHYDTLIDVGGFFIKTDVMSIVIKIYESFKEKNKIKKIVYLNKDDEKMIYDGNEKKYNNEINDIFIYYDNKHTIGIDFKQPYKMRGLVTINNNNTLTEVVQGIFRLRNINIGHTIDYFYNKDNNNENITLKYIYSKLIKNGNNRKLETKSKMQYQCIKYLDRTINKNKKSYYEHIYYDNYKEHINTYFKKNIQSYQDYINLHIQTILQKININSININNIILNNNLLNTNININIDVDKNIAMNKNIKNIFTREKGNRLDLYIYNISSFKISFIDYFNIDFFKKGIILKIIGSSNFYYYNAHLIYLINDFFANICEKNENNFINFDFFYNNIQKYIIKDCEDIMEQIGKSNNQIHNKTLLNICELLIQNGHAGNIIKKINIIKLDNTNYYLSPLLIEPFEPYIDFLGKYQNKLFSLLIHNDLRLLLSHYETYNIIDLLMKDNKKNVYIYSIYNKLIYGNIQDAPLLKDNEKLILFNIFFDIKDTINILFQNDLEELYDMLKLIEFFSQKYYFNIEKLKNIKNIKHIDFYKLFNLEKKSMNSDFINTFEEIVKNTLNDK